MTTMSAAIPITTPVIERTVIIETKLRFGFTAAIHCDEKLSKIEVRLGVIFTQGKSPREPDND